MRMLCVVWLATAPLLAGPFQAGSTPATRCVDLGTPKPALSFVYRSTTLGMGTVEYTHKWDELTLMGSRLVTTTTGAGGAASTRVNRHRVVDDLFVVDSSTSSGPSGPSGERTSTYKPGAMGDPAFRACEGKSWAIPAVEVTTTSQAGTSNFATVRDRAATLMIFAVHESITVPAGTFDTVRYVRTRNSLDGQLRDEVWKSIEHGVMVKHTTTAPDLTATDVLIAIR